MPAVRLLSLDSTGAAGSVCVAENDFALGEIFLRGSKMHAARLHRSVEQLMKWCDLPWESLDGVAVSVGPGSFTGVRIGLAAAKGLSYAMKKPLIGVSSLEALARNVPTSAEPVMAMLDAKKHQVYAARFIASPEGEMHRTGPERALSPEALLDECAERTLFVGEGAAAYRELICKRLGPKAVFAPGWAHQIRALQVAVAARKRILTGESDDPFLLTPNYLRPADAELSRVSVTEDSSSR